MDLTHHDSTFRNLRIPISGPTRIGFEKMNLALRCGRCSRVSSVRSRNITVLCLSRSLHLDGSYGQRPDVRRRARAKLLQGVPVVHPVRYRSWWSNQSFTVVPTRHGLRCPLFLSFFLSWRLSAKCVGALNLFLLRIVRLGVDRSSKGSGCIS
jgi:hypothetical protein